MPSVTAREARALPPAWVAQPELDDNVPPAITEALVRAYQQAGGDIERVHFPGAKHGFTNPAAGSFGMEALAYDAAADKASWAAMLKAFKEVF